MKPLKQFAVAMIIVGSLAAGVVRATDISPLATFATVTAADYVNFPINSTDVASGPFLAWGTLPFTSPQPFVSAFGREYTYEYSLLAYFDFIYSFIGDHGEFVDGQIFQYLFDSPSDYINVGMIPLAGSSYTASFQAQDVIARFNDKFHGLQDNFWSITGFRASVRHIYMVPEPTTLSLMGLGLLALGLGCLRRRRH